MSTKSKLIGILPLLFIGITAFSGDIELLADANLERAQVLGSNLEESIENNNPSYINNLFDLEKFLQNAIPESENPLEQAFFEGFTSEFHKSFDLGISIINEIGAGGEYTFLNAYSSNNTYYLIFRMLSDQTVNYHEYKLDLSKEEFSIIDVYNYYSGSYMSEILARVYQGGSLYITGTTDKQKQELRSIVRLNQISVFVSAGKFKKAMKQWYKIPAYLRNEKPYLAEGLKVAKFLDEETFQEVFTQYTTYFPEEGGKYLIALEALSYQERSKEALECLEKLDAFLHIDPTLNLIRANLNYELDNKSMAVENLKELIKTNPEYEIGYISLLGIYLEEKKYVDATSILDQIVYTFNSYKEDLEPILGEFPDFLDSTEYISWFEE
jgi:hypothetical protein